MDISWLGHACIRVRTNQTAVVMDPCDRSSGFDIGRPTADIVTVSNPGPHHSHVRGVRGDPIAIEGPGEYEIKGVQITGVSTYLTPPVEGTQPERNTAFVVESEELHLAHMGGLGAPLTAEQLEQLSTVDVLVLPISGGDTVDAEAAARTVRALEPAVVIPVRYPVSGAGDGEEGALQKFITGLSVDPERPGQRVSIQRRGLSETLRLVLLAPRG